MVWHRCERHRALHRALHRAAALKPFAVQAYDAMSRHLRSAAHTVVAVPVRTYEREGTLGAVKSVIRAVPVAVLRPMIGATEAAARALQGTHGRLRHACAMCLCYACASAMLAPPCR